MGKIDTQDVDEWNKSSNDSLTTAKKYAVFKLGMAGSFLLQGIVVDNNFNIPSSTVETISKLCWVASGVILGRKLFQAAACKASSKMLEFLGKEDAAEWSKSSDDYLTLAQKDIRQDLLLAAPFVFTALYINDHKKDITRIEEIQASIKELEARRERSKATLDLLDKIIKWPLEGIKAVSWFGFGAMFGMFRYHNRIFFNR